MVKWRKKCVEFPMLSSSTLAISDRPTLQSILNLITSLLEKCLYLLIDGHLTPPGVKLNMEISLSMVSVLMGLTEAQRTVLICSLNALVIQTHANLKLRTLELRVNKLGYGHISMVKLLLIRAKPVTPSIL
jgi:hypothetical protein